MANLFKARFPFLYISTWEEDRVLSLIRLIASNEDLIKTKRKVITWKITKGMSSEDNGKGDTKSPLKALEYIEKFEEPAIFVLMDFHIYFGDQGRLPDYQIIRKLRDIFQA